MKQFPSRWKSITAKLEQTPSRLSDLSSHPCFSKNNLYMEQLNAVSTTLRDSIVLADLCVSERFEGKLRMQSDLNSLTSRLDLNLCKCGLLIKIGVSGVTTFEKTTKTSIFSFPATSTSEFKWFKFIYFTGTTLTSDSNQLASKTAFSLQIASTAKKP